MGELENDPHFRIGQLTAEVGRLTEYNKYLKEERAKLQRQVEARAEVGYAVEAEALREQLASQRARFDEIVTGLRVRLAAAEELAETFEATDPGENWRSHT
jgi:hypothetical protein